MSHLQYLLDGGKSSDAKYAQLKAQHSGAGTTTTTKPVPPYGGVLVTEDGTRYKIATGVHVPDPSSRRGYRILPLALVPVAGGTPLPFGAGVYRTELGSIVSLNEHGDLVDTRDLPWDGGGDGSSAASAAASLAESRRQFDISQQYQTEIDKARMAAEREANLRSEMNDLRRARIQERMAANQLLIEKGK